MGLINKLTLAIMSLVTSCTGIYGQNGFKTIDADEFEKAISTDTVQLVDVRTADEFAEGHISSDNIKNIDMKQPDFMERAKKELDKSKTIAVYCRSGRRSAEAAGRLAAEGFKVIDLDGGILEWQARGKNTDK